MTEEIRYSKHKCRWCSGPVRHPRQTWCSDACVLEFTRRWHQEAFRQFVWRESDKCCDVCRIDLAALESLLRSLDFNQRAAVRQLLGFSHNGTKELWEADHILPCALDGRELDPKLNGRVLCRRCHKEKTRLDVVAIKSVKQGEAEAVNDILK